MRGLKIALIGFVGLLVLLFGAGAIFLYTFDVNTYRGALEAKVKDATGRDFKIAGQFKANLGLSPSIVVENVTFANAPWGSRPDMVNAKRFEIEIGLLPLLHGQITIERFLLSDTQVYLETDKDGRGNWEFDRTGSPAAAAPAKPKGEVEAAVERDMRLPEVHDIYLEGVGLHYRGGQTGQVRDFSLGFLNFGSESENAPLQVNANGTYNDFYFELDGHAGSVEELGKRGTPFPLDLGFKWGASPSTARIKGQLTNALSGRGYDVTVSAATDEIARVADFARDMHVATFQLPKLGPFNAKAHIVDAAPATERGAGGRPALTALKFQAGRPDLMLVKMDGTVQELIQERGIALNVSAEGQEIGALSGVVLPGLPNGVPQIPALGPYKVAVKLADTRAGRLTLPNVKLELGRDDLLKLEADGQVTDPLAHKGFALNLAGRAADLAAVARDFNLTSPLDGTLTLKGKIADTGPEQYALTGVKLEAAGSDIGGNATLSLAGAKPAVTADLTSSLIDLGKLWPKPKAAGQAKAPKPDSANPDEDRIFPADPLPFEILDRVEADLKYRADAIRTPRGPTFKNTAVQAGLHDGVLQMHPLSTVIGNGTITGELSIGGATGSVAGRLIAKGVSLDEIDHEVPGDDLVDGGTVDADWELHGGGKSVREIMAALEGSLLFTVGPAQFRSRYADVLGFSGLMDVVHKSLPPLETTHLNCFVTRFDIAEGIAKSRIAVADTQRLTLDGGGTVNLKTEELDFDFDTKTKVTSILSLMPPIHAGGTLAHPDFSPDVAGGALTGIGNILTLPADLLGSIFGGDEKTVCQVALAKAAGKPLGALPSPAGNRITSAPAVDRAGQAIQGAGQSIQRGVQSVFGK